MSFECNIDKNDRRNRIVLGVLILIALVLGFGTWFFALLAIVLIVEGLIGWCSIPLLIEKFKSFSSKKY